MGIGAGGGKLRAGPRTVWSGFRSQVEAPGHKYPSEPRSVVRLSNTKQLLPRRSAHPPRTERSLSAACFRFSFFSFFSEWVNPDSPAAPGLSASALILTDPSHCIELSNESAPPDPNRSEVNNHLWRLFQLSSIFLLRFSFFLPFDLFGLAESQSDCGSALTSSRREKLLP